MYSYFTPLAVTFALVTVVVSLNRIKDHFTNTVFDEMDTKQWKEDELKALRQVFVTNTEVYDGYGKEFEVVSWSSPQTIYNYSFAANAEFIYEDGGAGQQYFNLRVKSKAGQNVIWQGEIWAY